MEKYHSLATLMKQKLSPNAKEAVQQILRFIKAPETEWQIGKTKVELGYMMENLILCVCVCVCVFIFMYY